MPLRRGMFLFLCLLCFMGTVSFVRGENNRSVCITAIQNEQTHAMASEVVREAYRRIGYKARFVSFPGRRSLEMANTGESDGDVARIAGTDKAFPNLIPVPTPVIWFKGIVFTKHVTREISSWDDLNGLRVGVIRGIRYAIIGTEGLNPYFAEDMTHLFRLLEQDRIQVAVTVLDAANVEIHKNFRNSGIHMAGKPLYSAPLYHFVNKKNQHLIPDLNQALQTMTRQGDIDKILDNALRGLLDD